MIKVEYILPRQVLGKLYVAAFRHNLKSMRKGWRRLLRELVSVSSNPDYYPESVDKILTMPFEKLNDIYEDYTLLRSRGLISDALNSKLSMLFRYDARRINDHAHLHKNGRKHPDLWSRFGYQPIISSFFSNPQHGFLLHTCHYCNTAYINVFGYSSIYKDVLALTNTQDVDELKRYVAKNDGSPYRDYVYRTIVLKQPFSNIKDFNALPVFRTGNRKKKMSEQIEESISNQFDLDHVLPKSKCPIVGLSLFNFVPSCQVCNEKLKGDVELGETKADRNVLSPTSDTYTFDARFELRQLSSAVPKLGYLAHPDDYMLELLPINPVFKAPIEMFHLKERYNYHKSEALRLRDLLDDYNDSSISMIHNAFEEAGLGRKYTKEKIAEDIFGEYYSMSEHRAFSKLRADIIQQYKTTAP